MDAVVVVENGKKATVVEELIMNERTDPAERKESKGEYRRESAAKRASWS